MKRFLLSISATVGAGAIGYGIQFESAAIAFAGCAVIVAVLVELSP